MAYGRILVVEDDADINEIVITHLARSGHTCMQAFSGTEAMLALEAGGYAPFDLIICDLMLPGMSGERLIETVRERDREVPIVVISAKGEASDRVDLLRLGADDYLVKPFDLDELTARIEVQLRHRAAHTAATASEHARDASTGTLVFRSWELDPSSRTFRVDGSPLALTRTEFNLLETLMRQPKRAFSKHDLFEAAWGEPSCEDDNTVAVHVSNIRTKLKASGTDRYIKTVWGIGFKLTEE